MKPDGHHARLCKNLAKDVCLAISYKSMTILQDLIKTKIILKDSLDTERSRTIGPSELWFVVFIDLSAFV